jgi:hypothetical protein
MAEDQQGKRKLEAPPTPKHFDEVRANKKGSGEKTHPANKKTMGGAERIPEKALSRSNENARAPVNSEPSDGAGVHANAMKTLALGMASHHKYMENKTGGSPPKGDGLNEPRGADHANTEYEMTEGGLQHEPLP